ncbi:GNAT family N-acetyltransferase [Arsukibacterium indicum]|uniref:GNAT family N-acetyltransferase n=1 Tax=Arsukibacterium indicum TaxID=2848612 RepID=A0ABS6MPR5_9GAMM|nr:GNAT family N-acetyltransferase [Arsukibacterium indicum]MBV2130820.1 GNAT family N-acetyltransferase [Arsukibacterium indicum]
MSDNLITTWYLQFQGPALRLPRWPADCLLMEATIPSPELSQFLFTAVGNHWRWFSRLSWDYHQWLNHLSTDRVRTWVLYQEGTIAGFIELNLHPAATEAQPLPPATRLAASIELTFFGLLPAFTGKGLGPILLTAAVALAQQWLAELAATEASAAPAETNETVTNVWVHTCSDDHPAALATYQQAGFAIYHTSEDAADTPENYADAALCRNYILSRLAQFKRR